MFRGILLFALLFSIKGHAAIELGVGLNSAFSGRYIPVLTGAIGTDNWIVTGSSAGVRNHYYYHSVYSATFLSTWESGDFLWGKLNSGFGVGGTYMQREFKDLDEQHDHIDDDFTLGPAFRVQWMVFGPAYLNLEVILGVRDLWNHVLLNFQDHTTFSIGVAL